MRSFVPETGFEPARPVIGATTSRWCVYQFRHPGFKFANVRGLFIQYNSECGTLPRF